MCVGNDPLTLSRDGLPCSGEFHRVPKAHNLMSYLSVGVTLIESIKLTSLYYSGDTYYKTTHIVTGVTPRPGPQLEQVHLCVYQHILPIDAFLTKMSTS